MYTTDEEMIGAYIEDRLDPQQALQVRSRIEADAALALMVAEIAAELAALPLTDPAG